MMPSSPGSDFLPLGGGQPGLPSAATLIPPPSAYLPQFPFGAHPELLHKSPFLPYDFPALRQARLAQHTNLSSTTAPPSTVPSSDSLTSLRLSPASSRPSSSSPPTTITIKINSSIEHNSSHCQSDEDSDDEQIDVVKSAFVPILRQNQIIPKVEMADSTVQDKQPPPRIRCDLKAPSAKKSIIHETAPSGPKSPDTKIKTATISTQKTVWRPY